MYDFKISKPGTMLLVLSCQNHEEYSKGHFLTCLQGQQFSIISQSVFIRQKAHTNLLEAHLKKWLYVNSNKIRKTDDEMKKQDAKMKISK